MSLSVARRLPARFPLLIVLVALSHEVLAQPDPRDARIRELEQRIEALEKIQELQQRVQALEKKAGERPAPPSAAAGQTAAPAAPAKPPAAPAKPAASGPTPSQSEEAGRDDDSARALERTLVREGGLVLPRKIWELEPRFQYTYRSLQGLTLSTVNGIPQVAQQDVRRDDFEASLAIRAGLPKNFQVEARLPYVWMNQNRATGTMTETEEASGWGDVELGLSKQLSSQRRGGVIGSVNWKPSSGRHEIGRLSPGTGFPQVQTAITAVLREDPLVFFVSPSYSWVFARDKNGVEVDPGDAIGLKAGTMLAASPETSLRASLDLSRAGRTRIAGSALPGSDTTSGFLELGFAKLLTKRTLLDVSLGVGITPDAPDFRLKVSLPIRYGP